MIPFPIGAAVGNGFPQDSHSGAVLEPKLADAPTGGLHVLHGSPWKHLLIASQMGRFRNNWLCPKIPLGAVSQHPLPDVAQPLKLIIIQATTITNSFFIFLPSQTHSLQFPNPFWIGGVKTYLTTNDVQVQRVYFLQHRILSSKKDLL